MECFCIRGDCRPYSVLHLYSAFAVHVDSLVSLSNRSLLSYEISPMYYNADAGSVPVFCRDFEAFESELLRIQLKYLPNIHIWI